MKSWLWTWTVQAGDEDRGEILQESNPEQRYFWPEMAGDIVDPDIPLSRFTFRREAYTLVPADKLLLFIYACLFSKQVKILTADGCQG